MEGRDLIRIDWTFFGEMCRALTLRIRDVFDPDVIVGIAKAGVIPGAVVASMLEKEFASMAITREHPRSQPTLVVPPPPSIAGKKVVIVDETCDSGHTLDLAVSAVSRLEPSELKTAVCFKTGQFAPDYFAMATRSQIILPWDTELVETGEPQLVDEGLYRVPRAVRGKSLKT